MNLHLVSCILRTVICAVGTAAALFAAVNEAEGQVPIYYSRGGVPNKAEAQLDWFGTTSADGETFSVLGFFRQGNAGVLEGFDYQLLAPAALSSFSVPGESQEQAVARYFSSPEGAQADGAFLMPSTCVSWPGQPSECSLAGCAIEPLWEWPANMYIYGDMCNFQQFDFRLTIPIRQRVTTIVGIKYVGTPTNLTLSICVNAPNNWFQSPTGHAFVELTDLSGPPPLTRSYGFYSERWRPFDRAVLRSEVGTPFTETISWPLTRAQYNAAVANVRRVELDVLLGITPYHLLLTNCTDFAAGVAAAAGVDVPPHRVNGIATPRTLGASIRQQIATGFPCFGIARPRGRCMSTQSPFNVRLGGEVGRFYADPDWFLFMAAADPDLTASALLTKAMYSTVPEVTVGLKQTLSAVVEAAYPESTLRVFDPGDGTPPMHGVDAAEHTYHAAGTYPVRVIVIDPAGVHVIRFDVHVVRGAGPATISIAVPHLPPHEAPLNPGEPPEMPPFARTFPADPTCDWVANGEDLAMVLAAWGSTDPTLADIDDDGVVSGNDLAVVLAGWGSTGK